MSSNDHIAEHPTHVNPYTVADVVAILLENHWLSGEPTAEQAAWAERAAELLGHYAENREGLANLLCLVFHYDAAEILATSEAHTGPGGTSRNQSRHR